MKRRIGGLALFTAVILLASFLAFGKTVAQGVASAVSLFYNGAYVSATNPLPVTGSVTVSPGPAQTTPVTCATPSCAVVDYQGTSPWVVSTINPSLPAPQATWPVTTPAPAPTTTGGWPGTVGFNVGSGALYANNICDTYHQSTSIVTATTTLLITGTNNQSVYVCLATWESTGTNATNTVQFEYGQGATCSTNTVTIFPVAIAPGTASGEWLSGWSGTVNSASVTSGIPGPAAVPLVLPNNATAYNLCGVTAGTTTLGNFVVWYSIH